MIKIIRKLKNIDYCTPDDLPDMDLYMDQVTSFMDRSLASSKRHEDDKVLTKTMINNYSKNKLLPPSEKKKYSKDHMVLLLFIYYYKSFLSINDIKTILEAITEEFYDSKKGRKNLSDIYEDIYNISLENMDEIVDDLLAKYDKAEKYYENIKDDKEKKLSENFAFFCSLAFDIWVKKYIIEKMIDDGLFD